MQIKIQNFSSTRLSQNSNKKKLKALQKDIKVKINQETKLYNSINKSKKSKRYRNRHQSQPIIKIKKKRKRNNNRRENPNNRLQKNKSKNRQN